MPQHSFVYFLSAQDVDLEKLPSVLKERYALLTWRDSHAPAYATAEAAPPDPTVLAMVEASHTRLGGSVGLGVTPGQRLGLEPTPYRNAAFAAMHHEAACCCCKTHRSHGGIA